MADEPVADVVARVLYERHRTARQLVADGNTLAREVERLTIGVEEAWVIMFGDEHLLSASPAGDICESCGEGWPCTVVEWGAMYREVDRG